MESSAEYTPEAWKALYCMFMQTIHNVETVHLLGNSCQTQLLLYLYIFTYALGLLFKPH